MVSSRTYVSNLERGIKVPTIRKVDSLAAVLGIHPLTLLALSYIDTRKATESDLRTLLTGVFDETAGLLKETSASS